MGSPGLFYFLSLSSGSLAAALAALMTESIPVQCTTFLIITLLSLLCLRFWVTKSNQTKSDNLTNIDALVGKQGIVIRVIDHDKVGEVKVGGEVWSARSLNQDVLPEGESIVIVRVTGAHLVVQKESAHRYI